MARFVPLSKQSKKKQKAYHRQARGDWGEVRPVTRVIESGKRYVRAKAKQAERQENRDTTE